MALLTSRTCPHCGAETGAFHHTRWDTMESRADAGPEFCPGCGKPLDPERDFWQEAAGSGELGSEATIVFKLTGAAAVAATIVYLTIRFYYSGYTPHGLIALALLTGFAVVLAWLRATRPEKAPPLVEFELLPDAPSTAPPAWDTEITEGVRAVLPPPRDKPRHETKTRSPASPQRRPLPLTPDEIARQVALAWLEPEGGHPIREHIRVLSDSTSQWPPMRSIDADLRLGTPVAIGRNGTRAYATVREDGRGSLSLLQRNGIERVLRFELKRRRRRA